MDDGHSACQKSLPNLILNIVRPGRFPNPARFVLSLGWLILDIFYRRDLVLHIYFVEAGL
jgi:hypothetical protein